MKLRFGFKSKSIINHQCNLCQVIHLVVTMYDVANEPSLAVLDELEEDCAYYHPPHPRIILHLDQIFLILRDFQGVAIFPLLVSDFWSFHSLLLARVFASKVLIFECLKVWAPFERHYWIPYHHFWETFLILIFKSIPSYFHLITLFAWSSVLRYEPPFLSH